MIVNLHKLRKEYLNGFEAGFFGWFPPNVSQLTPVQAEAVWIGYRLGQQALTEMVAVC